MAEGCCCLWAAPCPPAAQPTWAYIGLETVALITTVHSIFSLRETMAAFTGNSTRRLSAQLR